MSAILNSKFNQLLVTLVLVGVVSALTVYSYVKLQESSQWDGPMTINVSGKGEVSAKPDIAQFSFSVRAEGADATAAQTKSTEVMNVITAYLAENEVAEKDIKTEGYNLNQKFRYDTKPCAYGTYCPPGEPIPDGFTVYQTVTVKVRAIDKAGVLLGGVGDKGATDISSLNFTVDDEEVIKMQARDLAIADAKAQSEKLAASLGVKIVKMINFYEDTPGAPMYGYGGSMMDTMSVKAEAAPVANVQSGENKTVSNVTITYEIK